MMTRILLVVLLLIPGPAAAQGLDAFFDDQTLQEVRIFIHSQDLREMRERYAEDIYYPADFTWRGIRVRNVGVRVRGLATRSAIKPGLRIDFNRYVEGQEFFGLSALVLDNVLKDPSFIRERISMALIARMGQPAPRESFGRLYINNVYEGLYAFVEPVDAGFLARTLGDGSGYLFEHKFVGGYYGAYLGDDYEPYKLRFAAQTHVLEPDSVLYLPIRDLLYEVNQEVDGVWRDRVGRYIDLPQLVTHVAVETFLAEIDGFLGTAGMANFYLYRPASGGAHQLLAWDRDTTFQDVESPIFARVEDNALFRRALAFGDLHAQYLDVLAECARLASENRWLETEIVRAHVLIRDAVYEDTRKLSSNEQYEAAIAGLVSFAQRRPAFVAAEVAKAR
jgi:spore coat protein CotH